MHGKSDDLPSGMGKLEISDENKDTASLPPSSKGEIGEMHQNSFLYDLDDSSGEENEINDGVGKYSVSGAWKRFSANKTKTREVLNNVTSEELRKSFTVNALGRACLYSDKVNRSYYPLKEKNLKIEPESWIRKAVIDTIERTLERCLRDLCIVPNIQALAIKFRNELIGKKPVQDFIEKFLEEGVSESFKFDGFADYDFFQDMKEHISEEIGRLLINHAKLREPKKTEKLTQEKITVKNSLVGFIYEDLNSSKATKSLIDLKKDFKRIGGLFKTDIQKSLPDILPKYIDTLRQDENTELKIKRFKGLYMPSYMFIDEDILRYSSGRYFLKEFQKRCDRKVLPEQFKFNISTPISHLAAIRLSNRSQQRSIKNLEANPLNRRSFTVQRAWQSEESEHAAKEEQKITVGRARQDLVADFSSYRNAYQEINKLIEKVGNEGLLNEQIFAQLVRDYYSKSFDDTIKEKILSYQAIIIKHFITEMVGVIFGSEVARNPSSFIVNNMVLDLIIAGTMSWKEAFCYYTDKLEGKALEIKNHLDQMSFLIWKESNPDKEDNLFNGEIFSEEKIGAKLRKSITKASYTAKDLFTESQRRLKVCAASKAEVEGIMKDAKSLRAFENGKLPMSPVGAVHASRKLNELFSSEYMPHSYTYPGSEDSSSSSHYNMYSLIKAEAEIVDKWVSMKQAKQSDKSEEQTLEDLIGSSISGWMQEKSNAHAKST